MSFTNITPDRNPDGSLLSYPGLGSGTRFFYFTFTSPSTSLNAFLSRNIFRNEEYITQIYDENNAVILKADNVSNIVNPTTFDGSRIGLSTPNGVGYSNVSTNPNFKLNNLIVGKTYTIESRTVYNDRGTDFGLILRNGIVSVPLTYVRTHTLSMPLPPPPIPPIPPTPSGAPSIPTGLTVSSVQAGVYLTWNASVNATSYRVYRCGFFIGSSAGSAYVDSHVISGAKYSYAVSAVNSQGESAKTGALQIVPSFTFTNLVPDRTPTGDLLTGYGIRYFYYLFTPITSSVDVFLSNNGSTEEAIVGLYDTTDSTNTNLFTNVSNITNLDSNVQYGILSLGSVPNPTLTVMPGLRISATGAYSNPGMKSNFRINNLLGDLSIPSAVLKTYILEIVTVNNKVDIDKPDLGAYLKNVGSGVFASHNTQLVYHTSSPSRITPTPYVIAYNFEQTSAENYATYIYPLLRVFQNCKTVLENIISSTHGARAARRTNDMLVNFLVEPLDTGIVGQSSLTGWKVDPTRSPDFTYEQDISFSSTYFSNGYLTGPAQFNGSSNINGHPNSSLFNVLIHEILHGIGIFYTSSYNKTNMDVGWSPYLINVPNDPWYKGSTIGTSFAIEGYKTYCGMSSIQHIPIEKDYGAGTALSHWDEGNLSDGSLEYRSYNGQYHPALRLEIMSGFTNSNDYLTRLTAGVLKDYGYAVNLNSPYIVGYPGNLIPTGQLQIQPAERNAEGRIWHRPVVKCECIQEDGLCTHVLKMEQQCWSTNMVHFGNRNATPAPAHTYVGVANMCVSSMNYTFVNRQGIPYATNYYCSTINARSPALQLQ